MSNPSPVPSLSTEVIIISPAPKDSTFFAHSLTSSIEKGDFTQGAANALGLNFNTSEPIVAVIKKNPHVLRRIYQWLGAQANEDSELGRVIRNKSLLLIDDEADNASINISNDPERQSSINGWITQILNLFGKNAYVGYTATPFANIFIPLDDQNLFPRNFIKNIPAPSNYVGPEKVFGFSPLEEDETSNTVLPIVNRINDYRDFNPSQIFDFTKYYSINNLLFKVQFQSEHELSLIHPKFSHLEVKPIENISFHYKVFTQNKYIFLLINNDFIGSWSQKDVHFFQGKFSMQIVQDMHHKLENEWLGVFHASAVSNRKESMMFLGDSGNGKSTSLALLQANGYCCIADDFVLVAAQNNEVYSFPSAISIKRNSLETLLPYYPELENSAEFHFKKLNKIVRYLPPNNCDYKTHQPCKALIFIKYKKDVDIVFNKISNINAFENLIPDSWLSPIQKNTEQFLDWFVKLPCYEITYSNNAKMIKTVSKIFNNDL